VSLPSERLVTRLRDILQNVDRIERYTEGYSFDRFVGDNRCQDAVERCLLRISEAARKLADVLRKSRRTRAGPAFAPSGMSYGMNTTGSNLHGSGASSRKTLCLCGGPWKKQSGFSATGMSNPT
jgi:hypothetical protein